MTDRPTPEQIASTYKGGTKALRRVLAHGYRVVHPDDVPAGETQRPSTGEVYDEPSWVLGWYDCRHYIFGDDA